MCRIVTKLLLIASLSLDTKRAAATTTTTIHQKPGKRPSCPPGYQDHTQGRAWIWRCGEKCHGSRTYGAWSDYVCHCACVLPSECLESTASDSCVVSYEKTGVLPTVDQASAVASSYTPEPSVSQNWYTQGTASSGSGSAGSGGAGSVSGGSGGQASGTSGVGSGNAAAAGGGGSSFTSGISGGVQLSGATGAGGGNAGAGGGGGGSGGSFMQGGGKQGSTRDTDSNTTVVIAIVVGAGVVFLGCAAACFFVCCWMDLKPYIVTRVVGEQDARAKQGIRSWGVQSWALVRPMQGTVGQKVQAQDFNLPTALPKHSHDSNQSSPRAQKSPTYVSKHDCWGSNNARANSPTGSPRQSPRNSISSPRQSPRNTASSPRQSPRNITSAKQPSPRQSPRNGSLRSTASGGAPGQRASPQTSPRNGHASVNQFGMPHSCSTESNAPAGKTASTEASPPLLK